MKTAHRTATHTTATPRQPAATHHEVPSSCPEAPAKATGGQHRRRALAILAVAAVALMATVGLVVGTSVTPTSELAPVEAPDRQDALERLVRLGYVPDEALEPAATRETLTRGLQARGFVATGPAATSSDAAEERSVTRSLVNRGLVPRATMPSATEDDLTHDLIVRGLIPEGS